MLHAQLVPLPFVGRTITQVCWVAQVATGAHGIVRDFEEPPQYRFELPMQPTSHGIFRRKLEPFRSLEQVLNLSLTKAPGMMMEIQIPKQTSTPQRYFIKHNRPKQAGGVFGLISHDKTNPMSLIDPY